MRIGLGTCLLVLAGCAPALVHPTRPPPPDGAFVAGYHPYWTGDAWTAYPFDVLDRLYFFETEARPDGTLERHGWPSEWSDLTAAARAAGVGVAPTVSMHDEDGFEVLFADPDRVERLVESIINLVDEVPDVSGVHLDFEVFRRVDPRARDGFTGFVVYLADELRRVHPGVALSVFTLAFDGDDVYNERALGRVADYLVVQGYDYHSPGSESAGPTAPTGGWRGVNWSSVIRRFDDFGVPRSKIVMSVPLFGYEWPVSSDERGAEASGAGTTIPLTGPGDVLTDLPRARTMAERYGTERDEESGSVWYRYQTADGWRQGWFDDDESLRRKYAFVKREGLGGIAIFPLAYGDDGVWSGLRAAFPPR
ncbi:MAG: glycosyl hydrolase family 18 protein [Gemmatimonadota bacterium]